MYISTLISFHSRCFHIINIWNLLENCFLLNEILFVLFFWNIQPAFLFATSLTFGEISEGNEPLVYATKTRKYGRKNELKKKTR